MPIFEAIRACFVEVSSAQVLQAFLRNATAFGAYSGFKADRIAPNRY